MGAKAVDQIDTLKNSSYLLLGTRAPSPASLSDRLLSSLHFASRAKLFAKFSITIDSAIDLAYKTVTVRTKRLYSITAAIIFYTLMAACTHPAPPAGPKFSGRLLLLAGDNKNGGDLVELTAAPTGSTYNLTPLTTGVFEAVASPDRTRLLYATKDEIQLRELRTGAVRPSVKGASYCLAWAPDGNHFSYKQQAKLYVSDLNGTPKLIWDDHLASATEKMAGSSDCPHWIAPDRLIFDRFVGAAAPQGKGGEAIKPNTTTLAVLTDGVKLSDTERKWSIESICPVGKGVFLRPHDQSQPILIAQTLDNLKTLNPKPADCSGCRFIGFAAQSCVPYFLEDSTSTSSELVSLNPISWQRQRDAHVGQPFSPAAKGLINSAGKLMIIGDAPASLFLVDTESGEITPFFPPTAAGATNDMALHLPVPIVWIEN